MGAAADSAGRDTGMALLRIDHTLRQLREELARIDYLIHLLESLAEGKGRRGRPPKLLAGLQRSSPTKRGKSHGSRRNAIRTTRS